MRRCQHAGAQRASEGPLGRLGFELVLELGGRLSGAVERVVAARDMLRRQLAPLAHGYTCSCKAFRAPWGTKRRCVQLLSSKAHLWSHPSPSCFLRSPSPCKKSSTCIAHLSARLHSRCVRCSGVLWRANGGRGRGRKARPPRVGMPRHHHRHRRAVARRQRHMLAAQAGGPGRRHRAYRGRLERHRYLYCQGASRQAAQAGSAGCGAQVGARIYISA